VDEHPLAHTPTQRLAEVRDRLFFIVGAGRSGTTLLRMMLTVDPEILVPHETRLYQIFEKQGWRRRLDLTKDADHERAITLIWENQARRVIACDRENFTALARAAPRTWAGLFVAYLTACADKAGATRVGEKSPVHTPVVGVISHELPEARFVHMVRDPRAVVLSRMKAGFGSNLVVPNIDRWSNSADVAVRYSRELGPERYLLVKYEDFVAEPRETLQRVCDFLGVEMTERMLEHHKREETGFGEYSRQWMENTLKPVFTSSIDKWKDEMSPTHIAMVEAAVGDAMRELGYEPVGPRVPAVRLRLALSRAAGAVEHALGLAHRAAKFALRGFKRAPLLEEPEDADETASAPGAAPETGPGREETPAASR